MTLRLLTVCSLFLLNYQAFAAAKNPLDGEKTHRVLCEYYLSGTYKRPVLSYFKLHVFDHPFYVEESAPLSEPAYRKLGLSSALERPGSLILSVDLQNDESMDPIAVTIQRFTKGALEPVWTKGFPDDIATGWRKLELESFEMGDEHDLVIANHPLSDLNRLSSVKIGFHSDLDEDGVRTYVAVRGYRGASAVELELGLDVPCGRFADFQSEYGLRDQGMRVRTPAGTLCRVPAFTFSRPWSD